MSELRGEATMEGLRYLDTDRGSVASSDVRRARGGTRWKVYATLTGRDEVSQAGDVRRACEGRRWRVYAALTGRDERSRMGMSEERAEGNDGGHTPP
jgi:hypothetical protein